MKWEPNNKKWIYLDRKEEPNLQIDVTFKEKTQPKKLDKKNNFFRIIRRKD